MPYTNLGDIHRIEFNEGFSAENLTLILTLDNLLVFHDNIDVSGTISAGKVICTLPELNRPAKELRFPVVALRSTNGYTTVILVLRPNGELVYGSTAEVSKIFLDGVVLSVSDSYYHYTEATPFGNTCPTTANALKQRWEEYYGNGV